MNCEQCKEEVFELIAREAVDPAGVQEILDRCPDCRALFDEMKVALVAVDQLPLEDPPARVDADILRAALMRRTNVTRVGKRRFQAPPWAMAAIALLAVGIGVWAIPRDTELATEDAFGAPLAESVEDIAAEPRPPSAPAEIGGAMSDKAEQGLRLDQQRSPELQAKGSAKSSVARRERAPAKRKTVSSPARQPKAAKVSPTEGSSADVAAAMDVAEAPAANSGAAAAPRTVALASESEEQRALEVAKKDADDAYLACKKTVASFEKRRRRDADFKPRPEQQLALGRCYAKLGDTKQARTWLERAAAHAKTRTRAQTALRKLTPN